jgi:NodT family efflux transporter outer membrane factor (OMF) lipoprotein
MKKTKMLPFFAGGFLLLLLASCKVYEPYQKPDIETESLYPHDMSLDSTTLADMPWRELFEDPYLQDLISEGLANNYNLKIAVQQIRQAEAFYKESRSRLFPSLTIGATYAYSDFSEAQGLDIGSANQFTLSASTRWEADIWGKLSNAKNANLTALLASEAARRVVQTQLIADIAITYYNLLALDQQLEITQQTVENRITTVETIKSLHEGAVVTGAAVVQTLANRYSAEIIIPDLIQSIEVTENTLSILMGRPPSEIKHGEFESLNALDSLKVGIPAQLLRNRPDIIRAEYQFRSAFELTQSAKAYFYPQLTITAEGGFQNLKLVDLLNPASIFANIIGGLTQPIFQNRTNKRRLEVAKAQQRQALYNFKNTVLNAGLEVSNALSSYKTAKQKAALRTKQLDALQKSVEFSQELLEYGEANYTEVLNAQQSLLSARLGSIQDQLQQLQAVVSLYRALGGGWNQAEGIEGMKVGIDE